MLPWRLGRAFAVAGGVVGLVVAVLASVAPVRPWSADEWSRALVVPLALLLAAALALRPRAGPTLAGRFGWSALVAGLAALLVASAIGWPSFLPALVAMLGALLTGAAAGRRRSLPRAAWYAMVLAPAAVFAARAALREEAAAGAFGMALVLLVVGASTID